MHNIQIDIVSDIACPWCAIGYARLEQAMKSVANDYEFNVQWHAFELNPDHNGEGEPILPALARKYGRPEAEMRESQTQMMKIAKQLGVNFDKLQERFTCSTFDAHRLVKWADDEDKSTAMKQELFEAYFGRAENVSDHDVLVQCAEAIGLNATRARDILASDSYAQAVRNDEATYQHAGVTAVPAFIINQIYLISGAQEAETLAQAFNNISAETE
ncbi:DsbA family oxidoreductase [Gilvimarinus sp. SDUM040013]|uniref:DsbA family oxidoreductase n=1 Tax=Gilvimarinus gilvus TaxID=3058038 RepID=A0ABU4S325_9GAMM|nr:DsbA family oxidoreductase [Gilvimarinus sp. SDUM040013]MDO3387168.1 DsbA family oxidoreductase [Gilvimarinus sp. SDUM040013]MDX6850911.1 DsbA family oxidoreductase [Gilvimarinus sp. SDUM040013]